MKKTYAVDVTKEQLTFSAAHFITFAGDICERIHGHNYGVSCRVEGGLDENQYVVDFIALRDGLAKISLELDHHVILPDSHPTIKVQTEGEEVVAKYKDRRWVFPKEDCVILPVSNTTAELIASYFVDRLVVEMKDHLHQGLKKLIVRIDENQGQWAECQVEF